jgi:hypothetical protein
MRNANHTQQPDTSPATGLRREWEAGANARIELDGSNLDECSLVFKRNEAITAAYAEMYLRNPRLYKWAGMAALTSATVGRGMYIMHSLGQTFMGGMVGLFRREVAETFRNLGVGNRAVFKDIYWQHMAYEQGGLAELERVFRAGQLDRRALRGWRQIDAGRRTQNADLVWQGNTTLLYFEQKEVLQPQVYDINPALWKEIAGWVPSPIPGHRQSFEEFVRGGNIAHFADRWGWIEGSMLPHWRKLADTQSAKVKRTLQSLMLGGSPLALPGLPMLKLRLGVYQAIGWGGGLGLRMPKLAMYGQA